MNHKAENLFAIVKILGSFEISLVVVHLKMEHNLAYAEISIT
jgi:uncharacterized membrane protein YecN with MAPEG domain